MLDISLTLLVDDEEPDDDADFILFRDRNSALSTKWESAGFRVINRSEVNRIANDKLKTFELAALLGIPAVPTKKVIVRLRHPLLPCCIENSRWTWRK